MGSSHQAFTIVKSGIRMTQAGMLQAFGEQTSKWRTSNSITLSHIKTLSIVAYTVLPKFQQHTNRRQAILPSLMSMSLRWGEQARTRIFQNRRQCLPHELKPPTFQKLFSEGFCQGKNSRQSPESRFFEECSSKRPSQNMQRM